MARATMARQLLCLGVLALMLASAGADDVPPSFLGYYQATHQRQSNAEQWLGGRAAAGAVLAASPAVIESGQEVVVSWSNVTDAQSADWLALYCPVESGSDSNYLDWEYATGESSGSATFGGLVNMRCNYTFRYYRGSTDPAGNYPLVAQSNAVSFLRGSDAPMQLHLALVGGASASVVVTWVTASNRYDNVVQYGAWPPRHLPGRSE